jgi:hypothetical protein
MASNEGVLSVSLRMEENLDTSSIYLERKGSDLTYLDWGSIKTTFKLYARGQN